MPFKIIKLYAIAILLGIATGLMGSSFRMAIHALTAGLETSIHWLSSHGFSGGLASALFSMFLVYIAWFLVKKMAPEASGSGVQEIEGALLQERTIFWRRLLPVKFVGGVLSISAKMVVGREGPTIQMGGNLGAMLADIFRTTKGFRNTMIAAGAGSGLATAFNAPLAGVVFIIEEMRNQFNFTFTNFKMVAIACVMSTITTQYLLGSGPAIPMDVFDMPTLKSLWLFFALGLLVGFFGLFFNIILMKSLALKDSLSPSGERFYVLVIGFLVGVLAFYSPLLVGGGYEIIHQSLTLSPALDVLLILMLIRFLTTMLCYSASTPGGIFAPMLALGTLVGLAIFQLFKVILPLELMKPGMFAVAGMGSLFSASVRAPLTGIILVVEMTQNYSLILPLMVSCLTSTTVVQLAKNKPIYTQLLKRTLKLLHKN